MKIKFKHSNMLVINRFIILGLIGLLLGSIFDLGLSKTLYFRSGFLAKFIRLSGEMPMIILTSSLALEIIFRTLKNYRQNKSKTNIPNFILAIIAFTIPAIISSRGIPKYFTNPGQGLGIYIICFYYLLAFAFRKSFTKISQDDLEKYFYFIVLSVLFSMVAMNLLKNIWSRARFHYMHIKNDYRDFSFWLIPQFRSTITDAYKSFPSGHTTSATAILALLFKPKLNSRFLETEQNLEEPARIFGDNVTIYKILIISWPLLTALGRILDGAHYLSDVSFAFILTALIIKLSYTLVYKNKHKKWPN